MTAYVNVQVVAAQGRPLVPNAALRFRPPDTVERRGARASRRHGPAVRSGTVYVLEGRQLRAVPVQTGISDGRVTEIVAGQTQGGRSGRRRR